MNLNIRESILEEHSKAIADLIASYILKNPGKVEELMDCFFDTDLRICQRASWPVCKLGIKNPGLLQKYIPRMLDNLAAPKHDAVVRNTIRVWAEMDIPEEFEGAIFEHCFEYLCSPQVAVAIRAFSISVAGNIALKYPELAQELRAELMTILQYETKPAVRVRARRYISILG